MKKIIRLTESDLIQVVKRVIKEQKRDWGGDLNPGGYKVCATDMIKGNDAVDCLETVKGNKKFSVGDFRNLMHPGLYKVKNGDTLDGIVKFFKRKVAFSNFTVDEIYEFNPLLNKKPDIKPNDILLIDSWRGIS